MSRLARVATVSLAFGLLVVSVPGLPVGLSYVVSDSMAPTIGVSDGVVRVPAGEVDAGDIVVFESPTRGQTYTTHRVVGETPQGFVTKGDNNRATDQAAGYPYVQRSDIHGQVLTLGGDPVVIPNLGGLVEHRTFVLTLGIGVTLLDLGTASSTDRPSRPVTAGHLLRFMTAVTATAILVMIVLGGTTGQVGYVAVEGDASAMGTVPANEPAEVTLSARGIGRLPGTYVAADAPATTVTGRQWNESTLELTAAIPPQPAGTTYRTSVRVYRYPSSLPSGAIETLHGVHPLVAALATTGVLVVPIHVLGAVVIPRHARLRTTGRWRRFGRRLRRLLH